MREFRDNVGRAWSIEINVASLKRVKNLVGLNILDMLDPSSNVRQKIADPCVMADVLYALVMPQADARSINDEQFGAALVGESIDAGCNALREECLDFFQSDRRASLRAVMVAEDQYRKILEDRAKAHLATLTEDEVRRIAESHIAVLEERLAAMRKNTNPPERSASSDATSSPA